MDASRFRAVVLLALTFAVGAAVGVAGDRLELLPGLAQATETEAESGEEGRRSEGRRGRQTTIEKFADDMGLTAAQRTQIEGYLDYFRSSARDLQLAVRPQYRALMDSVRVQIESVLTDDQVEQYRALLDERYGGDGERRNAERERDQNQRGDR